MAYEFDPKFPNRPQHEDFAALSAIVLAQDQASDRGMPFHTLLEGVVDLESLTYVAEQRAARAVTTAYEQEGLYGGVVGMLMAIYADAFRTGAIYGQQRAAQIVDAATPKVS